jgi:osmotically-inducible protein OsmY
VPTIRYNQSTGQHVDDNRTAGHVKEALAHDPQSKYDGVNVVAFNGFVLLKRLRQHESSDEQCRRRAKTAEGVGEVENKITIKETVSRLN